MPVCEEEPGELQGVTVTQVTVVEVTTTRRGVARHPVAGIPGVDRRTPVAPAGREEDGQADTVMHPEGVDLVALGDLESPEAQVDPEGQVGPEDREVLGDKGLAAWGTTHWA